MTPAQLKGYAILGGVAIAAYLVIRRDVAKVASTVTDVAGNIGASVNPYNQNNIFYQTASSVVGIATGKEDSSLGGIIFDAVDPRSKQVADLLKGSGGTVPPTVSQKAMQKAPTVDQGSVSLDVSYDALGNVQ